MSLSARDYKAVADVFADALAPESDDDGLPYDEDRMVLDFAERLAYGLADHFATDNPRFDRRRFLLACGFARDAWTERPAASDEATATRVAIVLPPEVASIDDTQEAFGPHGRNISALVRASEFIEIPYKEG